MVNDPRLSTYSADHILVLLRRLAVGNDNWRLEESSQKVDLSKHFTVNLEVSEALERSAIHTRTNIYVLLAWRRIA